ncbi:MAG: hypothetical protein P1U56_05790 [Saprospiraceae bacterium]|nr:hypothetical protein [Saprospiraceae bacterium]
MKKYIIRQKGWVFDDDTYNYDGHHDLIGIYDTKEEAMEKVDHFNHVFFLSSAFLRNRYQRNYNYSLNGDSYVKSDNLAALVAKALDVNLDEIYPPRNSLFMKDPEKYLSKLTSAQVKAILLELDFSFFTCIELEKEVDYLFKIKRNPALWKEHEDLSYYSDPDDFYYFDDDRDSDKHRIVKTKFDCYYYAIFDDSYYIIYELNRDKLLKGPIQHLSDTPALLSQIIENCPAIQYNVEDEVIEFTKEITPVELMSLDAVLSTPILLCEKIKITDIPLLNITNSYVYKEASKKYDLHKT